MTDLFAVSSALDARAVTDAIPPSVRRDVEAAPTPHRHDEDVILELGPWTPRVPARHLLPSFALLTARPPSVRFELAARRSGAWSPWIATTTLGDHAFAPLPTSIDGFTTDIDEVHATAALETVRLRVRVGGRGADAVFAAPWLVTLSASDGAVGGAGAAAPPVRLAVPARTQMTEPDTVRLRLCSPTSVGMALEYLGCAVPTPVLADEIFHALTDRYGVWPAAVRTAGGINRDEESRVLLGFLHEQRAAVLRVVKGLPEDAWQKPAVPSGWTVAGSSAVLSGSKEAADNAGLMSALPVRPECQDGGEDDECA